MKRMLILLIVVVAALWGCGGHTEEAARAVCNKVSASCTSMNCIKNISCCATTQEQETVVPEEVNAVFILENTTQILSW